LKQIYGPAALLLFILALGSAVAIVKNNPPIRYFNDHREVYVHKNCAETNTCSLKEVRLLIRDYHFLMYGEDNFGTSMHIWYRTDSLRTLEDYVFVQIVKGCKYISSIQDSVEIFEMSYRQQIFDVYRTAAFPDWIIDSIDTDPAYNSMPGVARHHLYRFNTPPYVFDKKTEQFFGYHKPKIPVLYVSDHPSLAMYFGQNKSAASVSFRYKMGLYRTGDVPATTDPHNVRFASPLVEFEWMHSWIYNHQKEVFEKWDDIAPICR